MRAKPKQQPRVRRLSVAWLVLTAAVLSGGCAATGGNPFRGDQGGSQSALEVDNRHWSDMTISIRRGGQVVRLGQVTTNSRRRFPIPVGVAAAGVSIHFVADPVGSGTVYESPLVALGEDEEYVWTLAVNIEHSTLVRR